MKITLLLVGKTDDSTIGQLVDDYTKRLNHYVSFNQQALPDLKKNQTPDPRAAKAARR